MDIQVTPKQLAFIRAEAFETLFGGAAGGGKSYGQLIDALLYALQYSGSKQLILRRTFPELEKSIIRTALSLFPRDVARYNDSGHVWRFANGSIIDFGYCDAENDVYKYQSAEYDVLRFDELTHFTESMYTYLISRVRGANDYPKRIKSSTNPGGIGHTWVKERFIDPMPPGTVTEFDGGTRVFLPSLVDDNVFLMGADPHYKDRLRNLSKNDQKALLEGCWDLDDGAYFDEWRAAAHVIRPFEIPAHWRRYVAIDYGLDMLAALWIALDEQGRGYVYREYCEGKDLGEGHKGLIVSDAAAAVRERCEGETIELFLAPPDLWSRRQETGRSAADYFREGGCPLTKTSNDRVNGWLAVHEWLRVEGDEFGGARARLSVFDTCRQLIRTLPAVQVDTRRPNDVAKEPHNITHPPDALRCFCVYWTHAADRPRCKRAEWSADMYEDYYGADEDGQAYLLQKWGDPF